MENPVISEYGLEITDMRTHCTLYTFAKDLYEGEIPNGIDVVKVARLTIGYPKDWHLWYGRYQKDHPGLRLLEVASIEMVDEREIPR